MSNFFFLLNQIIAILKDGDIYNVEEILAKKIDNGIPFYFVKWEGFAQ